MNKNLKKKIKLLLNNSAKSYVFHGKVIASTTQTNF